MKLTREDKNSIIKEFEHWHNTISLANWGKFPKNWKETSSGRANLKNGYWCWNSYKLYNLYKK